MKLIKKYIYIALGIIALSNAPFSGKYIAKCYADGQVSAGKDVTIAFPWVKSGKILQQRCDFLFGQFDTLVYETKDGKYFCLQGRIDTMNMVLANEVRKEDALQFLEKAMTSFVHDILSYPLASNSIITEGYIKNHADDQKILQPYIISEPHPFVSNTKNLTVSENAWIMNFNVATKLGAIEAWLISGTVDPLAITAFSRKIIKPNGTLKIDEFYIH